MRNPIETTLTPADLGGRGSGTDAKPPATVAAVDRAMAILDVFAHRKPPISLADLAAETDLYKSTILRLLGSLEAAGMVLRHADGGYTPGARLFVLGEAYRSSFQLDDVVLPVLRALVERGTESASFHVRSGEDRLCLYRIDSDHPTLDRIAAGRILPLKRGAAGRLLTGLGAEADPDALSEAERATWCTVSDGENDPQCAAVAAPVFGTGQTLQGSLSLSGPRDRFTPEAIEVQKRAVTDAARTLTEKLGGRWLADAL